MPIRKMNGGKQGGDDDFNEIALVDLPSDFDEKGKEKPVIGTDGGEGYDSRTESRSLRRGSDGSSDGTGSRGALVEGGNSGLMGASFNFINSIIGAGIVGIPKAVQSSGFFLGIFLICLVGWLTYHGIQTLIRCGVWTGRRGYESLCEYCLGRRGFMMISFFMLVFAFGAMAAYMVIIGDTIPKVLQCRFDLDLPRGFVVSFVSVSVILPLCLVRDMSSLASSSLISISADAVLVLIILARGPSEAEFLQENEHSNITITSDYSFAKPGFFAGLGTLSFAYVCHHSTFIVFNTLQEPTLSNWRFVSAASVVFAVTLSLLIVVGGYLSFFNYTRSDVLNNFQRSHWSIDLARLLLALTMVLTFPMENFVARHSLHSLLYGAAPSPTEGMTHARHIAITLALWGLATVIGIFVEDVGPVLEITGAFSASVIGFVLPAICYFRVAKFEKELQQQDDFEDSYIAQPGTRNDDSTAWQGRVRATKPFMGSNFLFYTNAFMLVFGIVSMIAGTITALVRVSNPSMNHPPSLPCN